VCTVTNTLPVFACAHHQSQVFDVVVVDEAAQALEAATWAGLLKASRAVLAGAGRVLFKRILNVLLPSVLIMKRLHMSQTDFLLCTTRKKIAI